MVLKPYVTMPVGPLIAPLCQADKLRMAAFGVPLTAHSDAEFYRVYGSFRKEAFRASARMPERTFGRTQEEERA